MGLRSFVELGKFYGGVPIAVENAMVYPPMKITKPLEGEEKEDTPCELSIPIITPKSKRSLYPGLASTGAGQHGAL